ncbi:MAG: aldo/keto reductase [Rubrobacter sp.]|nr:aldo/keto reductase [Rubrobacter sp.]
MRKIRLPSGEEVPALGQGTWGWGEDASRRGGEVAALRLGLELGMTLVDTAEMYADGGAEEVVGEAISGRRDEVFLVGKVLPGNASREGTKEACERSLERLGTDRLDLYLLHWRGRHPLDETMEAFEELVDSGKIRHWGVSNFDVSDMEELASLPGGDAAQTDQILYNLTRRGVEYDLLPWCGERGVPAMAYSPIEQGRMLGDEALGEVAESHGVSPAQAALAWIFRREDIIAIPKAGTEDHVRENRAALDLELPEESLAALDEAFPAPNSKQPLEIL